MVYVTKILRNFLYIKSCNHIRIRCQFNSIQSSRKYHRTSISYVKMYMENENKYAYNVMKNNGYVIDFLINKYEPQPITKEEFPKLLDKNWLNENPHTIFQLFSALGVYCSEHNICISNKQFDDFVDILTDSLKLASNDELKVLFDGLTNWPQPESIRTRNYIEVWAALDDECINRINKSSFDQMLTFISLFYMLNVTRVSDFCFKCLQKFASKAKQLNKNQIVKTLFFIGIVRKSPHDIHNLEVQIEERFQEFSIDELAIIAMGLFKTKTPIRSVSLVISIIEKIIANSKEIHEVSLAALLKIIRYSSKTPGHDKVYDLLTSLQDEIPRLSIMCNVHIALLSSATLTLHKSCLNAIADNVVSSFSTARLKDLERLVLTYGTFNYIPKTDNFFQNILEELRKPERGEEIKKHGRVFACCVSYLGLLSIYPVDLINEVLNPGFLQHSYGKHCLQYGREILCVHNIAKIFLKDKATNLLSDNQVISLAKKFTDYLPDENYPKHYNALEKMILDIIRVLRHSRGGKEYVTGFHILSHHQRGDIIICNNDHGTPVRVDTAFPEKKFGLLSNPIDSNLWIALIVPSRNTLLSSGVPTGHYTSKIGELNALGFHAAIVNWNIYSKFEDDNDKIIYLNTIIKEALNNKKIKM